MSGIIAQNTGRHTGLIKGASSEGIWNLIKTYTASSSADITFVDGTDDVDFSAYSLFIFKFINIHPQTDTAVFHVNFRDGGSAYDALKTTHYFRAYHSEADATSLARKDDQDVGNGTGVQHLGYSLNGDADSSLSGDLKIENPSSTTYGKNFYGRTVFMHSAPEVHDSFIGGYLNVTAAIDGVQFAMSTGNIDSGTISLFGIT